MNKDLIIHTDSTLHTQEPDVAEAEVRAEKITAEIRESGEQWPNDPPISIVQDNTENVPEETLAILPER